MLATPSLLAGQKPDPSGIIRLFNESVPKPANKEAWTNANIDGMRVRLPWSMVEPNKGSFDWRNLHEMLALATQHGKVIGFSVAAGVQTPRWVYGDGAAKYTYSDGSGTMPLPWDEIFLEDWLKFVRRLGARYDSHPAVAYVVMSGMGQNIETYLAQTPTDDAKLTELGGTVAWKAAAKKIISTYAAAFPTTPFFITAAKPFHSPEGRSALKHVVDWGVATYPGRFGIMNASLNANSTTVYYPNLAVYTYSSTQPVGFQMLCSEVQDPQRLQGTLRQALWAGIRLGAKFIEVYQADADLSTNQDVLANARDALKANASQ
jgi:Beta-galactosidase